MNENQHLNIPLSDFSDRTLRRLGGAGGRGPRRGVNGLLGAEKPRVPVELTAATRKRYHRPGLSRFFRETFVLFIKI